METTPSFRVSLHSIHSATTDESPENIIHCVQTCAHVCHLQRDPPFPAGEERNRRKQQQLVGIVPVYCALATASAAETETISFHFLGCVWNSAQHSHFRPTSGQEHCALFSTIGFSLVRRPPAPSRYLGIFRPPINTQSSRAPPCSFALFVLLFLACTAPQQHQIEPPRHHQHQHH